MARIKIGNVFPGVTYLLKHCAPAGFGLGTSAKVLSNTDDLNTIWQSGWYRWGENAPNNAPTIKWSNRYSYMRVDGSDEGSFVQTIYSVFGDARGLSVTRSVTEGAFGEWEFVNPPMEAGVEYRTTERWLGKAVYTKLFNFAPLPNNSESSVWLDITGATAVVDYSVTTRNVDGNVFCNAGMMSSITGSWAKINESGNIGVYITTNTDASHLSAYCVVRYVKN